MNPVLVLYINPYDFTDEATGRQIAGFSVEYLDLEQDPSDHAREGTKGLTVFKDTLEPEALDQFKTVPGLYELSHRRTRDSKGKRVERVNGGKFLRGINLAALATQKVASTNN
jgi:hypothetical protein